MICGGGVGHLAACEPIRRISRAAWTRCVGRRGAERGHASSRRRDGFGSGEVRHRHPRRGSCLGRSRRTAVLREVTKRRRSTATAVLGGRHARIRREALRHRRSSRLAATGPGRSFGSAPHSRDRGCRVTRTGEDRAAVSTRLDGTGRGTERLVTRGGRTWAGMGRRDEPERPVERRDVNRRDRSCAGVACRFRCAGTPPPGVASVIRSRCAERFPAGLGCRDVGAALLLVLCGSDPDQESLLGRTRCTSSLALL